MSRLPYICHFRAIVHTFEDWNEVFDVATWVDGFEMRSIKQYEKDKNDLSKYLNDSQSIQMIDGFQSYLNDNTMSAIDYGKEILDDSDMISRIIECDIEPDKEEHYYEIIGKLHYYSFQNYEGEWDSEDDVSDIQFQELAKEDVDKWAKNIGLDLKINKEV
jgi:hypothetical protein